ncbi:hypothetical protein BGLT_02192 [Caballeronia glathei]|uniref:Uncharacterized protein n=1 Tax=Caballeronia glathei TaxID=60547 RepID=A0A069PFW3_9BURK|nr:hypothetical protein [Caballeronia glathei]KDR39490.1 hypothetical protein BG61_31940 [Caballeronia glathei]CDY79411.1 hypothetical protein BGLT_02192 [Caballeronia glathei]
MDKFEARALFDSASEMADAIVTAKYGYCDPTDKVHGAAYDKAFYGLLSEHFSDMTIPDLMAWIGY